MSTVKKTFTRWAHGLRFSIKTFLGSRPNLYFPIYRLKSNHAGLLADDSFDLCVEGFPRSANSFAVSAIQSAQCGAIKIANHTHVPANALRACELGIPTVILIRNPKDAIISLTALTYQTRGITADEADGQPLIPFALQLEAWISFYRALDWHEVNYVIAPFGLVTRDLGVVVNHVNKNFGSSFRPFHHTRQNVEAVHEAQGYHAGPDQSRAKIKAAVTDAFERSINSRPELKRELNRANRIHERWISRSSIDVASSS